MTTIDWTQVEPVDVITGGTPCQDLSHAGKRAGMTEGTRSNLWVAMRDAIATIKPSLVVWENVGGAYSAEATSELEPCPGCVGDGPGVHLRALGRVLGDLASLGFDAEWRGLRAADVGAPHGRLRVFVVAWPAANAKRGRLNGWAPDALRGTLGRTAAAGSGEDAGVTLLSTPQARDFKGVPGQGYNTANLARDVSLLPTPAVNDMGKAYTPETWDAWCAEQQAKHGNGNGHGKSLEIEAQRLLPTPVVTDSTGTRNRTAGRSEGAKPFTVGTTLGDVAYEASWGEYGPAIARWESLTRPAPAPTETGPKGAQRLSPRFSEWMMGLPDGWVTDVPGITRNEALKALGNGVVPQQAAAAIADALTAVEVAA
jgi:DNA (cytosine-5)-methyltransferase 1